MAHKIKLGQILVQAGWIDPRDLRAGLEEQKHTGERLGEALVRMGRLAEEHLVRALSRQLGIPAVHLEGRQIDPEVLALLPRSLAEKYACLPLFIKREGGADLLYLGMEDPTDLGAIDDVSFRTGMGVRPVLLGATQLCQGIARFYGSGRRADAEADLSSATVTPRVGESAPPPEASPSSSRRHEVPTRAILRVLTHLLVEKGVISRQELLERVRDAASDRENEPA